MAAISFRHAAQDRGAQRLAASVGVHLALAGMVLIASAYGIARDPGTGPRYVYASAAWGIAVAVIILFNLRHHLPRTRFGPANRVTLARGVLVALIGGAIGLVEEASFGGWLLFFGAVAVLLLDGADGWIARRTGFSSPFGARFDWELDALFLVVLSVLAYDMGKAGAWVLAIGGLRYAFVMAWFFWPHLSADLPESNRRKVVCVVQVLALTICLVPVVSPLLGFLVEGGALAALCFSFVVDIVWLDRNARGDGRVEQ